MTTRNNLIRFHLLVVVSIFSGMTGSIAQITLSANSDAFHTKLFYEHLADGMKQPKKTTPVGNTAIGNAFTALPDKPAILVGFAFQKGDWFGTPIISACQPIYENQNGRFRGSVIGRQVTELPLVVEAKPGYVVSELIVCAPEKHVHGVKIVFRRIDIFHGGLDTNDSYESNWTGIELNSKAARVGDKTRPAIGATGRADEWVASLGLLYPPSSN